MAGYLVLKSVTYTLPTLNSSLDAIAESKFDINKRDRMAPQYMIWYEIKQKQAEIVLPFTKVRQIILPFTKVRQIIFHFMKVRQIILPFTKVRQIILPLTKVRQIVLPLTEVRQIVLPLKR